MKPIIYVASSVTFASEAHRRFVHAFKQELRLSTSALILEWIGKSSHLKLDDFYKRDFNNVRMCDAMIAVVDEPSIGLGMELQEAIARRKPLICLRKEGTSLSRLLVSAHDSLGLQIEEYRDMPEAIAIASDFVNAIAERESETAAVK
jgi:nucleoside 2-deoxyribosyltransferase